MSNRTLEWLCAAPPCALQQCARVFQYDTARQFATRVECVARRLGLDSAHLAQHVTLASLLEAFARQHLWSCYVHDALSSDNTQAVHCERSVARALCRAALERFDAACDAPLREIVVERLDAHANTTRDVVWRAEDANLDDTVMGDAGASRSLQSSALGRSESCSASGSASGILTAPGIQCAWLREREPAARIDASRFERCTQRTAALSGLCAEHERALLAMLPLD